MEWQAQAGLDQARRETDYQQNIPEERGFFSEYRLKVRQNIYIKILDIMLNSVFPFKTITSQVSSRYNGKIMGFVIKYSWF